MANSKELPLTLQASANGATRPNNKMLSVLCSNEGKSDFSITQYPNFNEPKVRDREAFCEVNICSELNDQEDQTEHVGVYTKMKVKSSA